MFSVQRRIVAVVLPHLACELARPAAPTVVADEAPGPRAPLAVLIDPLPTSASPAGLEDEGGRTIDAVDPIAFARGVRPGQRVSEAAALTAGLLVARISARAIEEALARVADVAMGFGPTVSVGHPDTVWIDVSGGAHLWGGEGALLSAVASSVAALGHRAHVAVADGPRVAQALARHAGRSGARPVAAPGRSAEALAPLPARALLDALASPDAASLLDRLGVRSVAELVRLPPAALAARLGPRAQELLALARGVDDAPLTPHAPPAQIVEAQSLEDGVPLVEALVFVARGLVARAAARLVARGEACARVELALAYDRSIAELRRRAAAAGRDVVPLDAVAAAVMVANDVGAGEVGEGPPGIELVLELPAPLAHEGDLFRAVKAKLEGLTLAAPVVALRLVLSRVGPAPSIQLGMGGRARGARAVDPDALPVVLSELAAELGPERVGVLSLRDDHRPEAREVLEPPSLAEATGDPPRAGARAARARARDERMARAAFGARAADFELARLPSPLRLWPVPLPIEAAARAPASAGGAAPEGPLALLGVGERVRIGGRSFVVAHVAFDRRVDGALWWTEAAASRDYLRVWLSRADGAPGAPPACVEAWAFVDRRTGEAFVQGLWE